LHPSGGIMHNLPSSPHAGVRLARRIFTIAGIYGVLALLPQYFLEDKVGRDFPPAITHPENYYGFIGVALAWQLVFFMLARDPVRLRPTMLPGALEKIAFGGAAVVLYLQGRVATVLLGAGIVDLVFAVLFLWAYRDTANASAR
jgi:hypothetical protein